MGRCVLNNKKLSIGVIGVGGIANGVHFPSLMNIDNVAITAVCDIIEERAAEAAAKYSIPSFYSNYREMIKKETLDAVFVLVQPDQIFRITLDCLNQGLDVFAEKPSGITSYQAQTLLRKSRETDRILQIGLNRRYIPLVRHVVRLMKETTKITQVEGTFIKHASADFYDGCANALECDTIHSIDLVRWIAGGNPVKAATVMGKVNSEVPNLWSSVFLFDNDVTGIIKANYQAGGRVHTFEIHGPGASAFINIGFGDAACEADIIYADGKGTHSISAAGSGDLKRVHIDGMELAGGKDYYRYYGYYHEDAEFIECVRTRKRPLADIEEAVKTMHLVDLLNNSRI